MTAIVLVPDSAICYTGSVQDERNERNERRDTFMFLGFVVLCGSVVLTVVVARGTWSSDAWTAVGAIGSGVQAIGVITALVYAGRQIRQAESVARRARDDDLLDRLEVAVYEELLPSWVDLWSAYQHAYRVVPPAIAQYRGTDVVDPENPPEATFTAALDALHEATRRTARARAKAFRTLARLGVRSQALADLDDDRKKYGIVAFADVRPIEFYAFGIPHRAKPPTLPEWSHDDMNTRYNEMSAFAERMLSRPPSGISLRRLARSCCSL